LALLSLLFSILLIILLLPQLNQLSGKDFSFETLLRPAIVLSMLGIVLIVGILGGAYPAFYLSHFSPVLAMKGGLSSGKGGGLFRKVLTVIQFSISAMMIASTLVVVNQLNYLQNKDQGWDMENIVTLQLPDNEPPSKMRLLKEKLLANPLFNDVTLTSNGIGNGSGKVIFQMETSEGLDTRGINFTVVDHDFVETLGIEMEEGRDFSEDFLGDTLSGVIVNQTLANRMNWDEAIGKRVQLGDGQQIMAQVIGVVKDYHQTGMYNKVESLMLLYRLENGIMYAKLSGDNNVTAMSYMEEMWKEVFTGNPFEYTLLEDDFKEQFSGDKSRRTVFAGFTLLTIVIACLGLFGLASYTTERRTKEIGVRKVFGASISRIIRMFSWEFLILILISFVIAFPVAWYLMSDWLEDFVYRYRPGIPELVLTVLLLIIPTALTVVYQSYRAATANPANSMRIE
jgi:putative ABC transport system permease protein